MSDVRSFHLPLCALYLVVLSNPLSLAQDARGPVEEAEERAKIAEAEKRVAEAERDALKARLGELGVETPKGTLTIEGKLEIEGQLLAYRSALQVAERIKNAVALAVPKSSRILFHDRELEEVRSYRAFLAQIQLMNKPVPDLKKNIVYRTDSLKPPCGPGLEAMPVPPLLAATAGFQVLSLFKTDTTVTGFEVKLDDLAVAAILAEKLREAQYDVVYPPVFYRGLFDGAQPDFLKDVERLLQDKSELQLHANTLATKKAELVQRKEKETDPNCKQLYALDIADVEKRLGELKVWSDRADGIAANLLKADAESGRREIQRLARAEAFFHLGKGAYIVVLKPVAAGGAHKVKTGIWGSSLYFSGGVILAYMLFDPNGALLKAGLEPGYGGFVKDEELNQKLQ
jgi:hypothetical protein